MSKAVNVLALGSEGSTSAVMHIRPDRQDLFPMARALPSACRRQAGSARWCLFLALGRSPRPS
jgi:hypothetical protein